jgi:hypothetical protein
MPVMVRRGGHFLSAAGSARISKNGRKESVMNSYAWFRGAMTGIAAALVLVGSGAGAQAQSVTTERQTVNSPAPVAAAPATTVVQAPPSQVQLQQPTPVTSKQVVTETHEENFMGTIAKNTLYGAVAGALVGGAVYFIARDDVRPVTVAYWASGGALVGAAVGIVEVSTREERNERAVSQVLGGRRANVAFVPRLVNLRF